MAQEKAFMLEQQKESQKREKSTSASGQDEDTRNGGEDESYQLGNHQADWKYLQKRMESQIGQLQRQLDMSLQTRSIYIYAL